MRTPRPSLVIGLLMFLLVLGWGVWATRNIDSETGNPVHPVQQATTCPHGAHLTIYEDGSGACYVGNNHKAVRTWDENTFPWDCTRMGNHICGHGATATITVADCTYHADGSGRCGTEVIPPLTEYDADFCHDIDPKGSVIVRCRQ